jgi:hypothetical protein
MHCHCIFLFFFIMLVSSGEVKSQHTQANLHANDRIFLEKTFVTEKAFKQDSVDFFRELNKHAVAAQKAGNEALWLKTQMLRNLYYMSGKQKKLQVVRKPDAGPEGAG